jgi:hypothetical protein
MKRSRTIALTILIVIVVCLALALLGYLFYNAQRNRTMNERPLVLIYAPLNRERIPLGEGTLTHVTARAKSGVERIDLWLDGTLLATQESPGNDPVSPMMLASVWKPSLLGTHVLVARAFSGSGVAGQATITIEVVEAKEEEAAQIDHIVEEEETLKTIAKDLGVDVEMLEDLNPEIGDEGLEPGDRVTVPNPRDDSSEDTSPGDTGDEGISEELGSADETPPAPQVNAPGSLATMIEILGMEGVVVTDNEPVGLRVEVLALETDSEYESTHCYVGLGDNAPRWYPDPDGDQSTDDSFDSLGGGSWDVVGHLSGLAVPIISWPGGQPLPIDITCVGMGDGGADAIQLGHLEILAEAEEWDGITRRTRSAGAEGFFTVDYRISREQLLPIEPQPWIDEEMTPPIHLRFIDAHGRYFLGWEYEPREDESIDGGFRIYLNGTLQWVEPPDERFTEVPEQWRWPPCGEEYEFTVSAFYTQDCPDCRESEPSNIVTVSTGEVGDRACGRRVYVDFETLFTGDLGGDGEGDPGDVGPVYGSFFAGDQSASFDTECEPGELCDAFEGLVHNGEYIINRRGGLSRQELAQFRVYVPDGEDLVLGFDITDKDTGIGNDDDPVCAGIARVNVDVPSSGTIETLTPGDAPADRCRVTYRVVPLWGPAVAEGEGPALPHLRVEGLTVSRDSMLYISVRNIGNAAWTGHDLTAVVKRQSGEPIGVYTWPELYLEPEEVIMLSHPDLAPERPMDACVILDPGNEVRELLDRSAEEGSSEYAVERYCTPLPDLTIADVELGHSYEAGDYLAVEVENTGTGDFDRNLTLHIEFPDGSYFTDQWPDVSIDRGRSVRLVFPNLQYNNPMADDLTYLEMLRDGFTVVADPRDEIAEEDEENNTYENTLVRVRVEFTELSLQFYPFGGWSHSGDEIYFRPFYGHGPSQEEAFWVNRGRFPEFHNLSVNPDDCPYVWRVEELPGYGSEFYMPADENVYVWIGMRNEQEDGDVRDYRRVDEYGPDANYGDSDEEYEIRVSSAVIWEARWRITRLD